MLWTLQCPALRDGQGQGTGLGLLLPPRGGGAVTPVETASCPLQACRPASAAHLCCGGQHAPSPQSQGLLSPAQLGPMLDAGHQKETKIL